METDVVKIDRNTKLVAMDLDGTLTQHKSPLEPECQKVLEELARRYCLIMVCAGGCERIYQQLEFFPIDIIGYYGMQLSTTLGGKLVILENDAIPVDKEAVLKCAEAIRIEFDLLDYAGDSIEFHSSGLITFPILGTAAKLNEKLLYDPDRAKRRQYLSRVKEDFCEYTVFIGGTSSFDIVPRPYSKLYALENYLNKAGINRECAIYFGDDYGIGGNDRDVYESDIWFIEIDNYKSFPSDARKLLLS